MSAPRVHAAGAPSLPAACLWSCQPLGLLRHLVQSSPAMNTMDGGRGREDLHLPTKLFPAHC